MMGWSRVVVVSIQGTEGWMAVLGSAKGAGLERVAKIVPVLQAARVGEGGGHNWREDCS